MDKRDLTKKIVGYVVAYGSGIIVSKIIQKNVETERIDQRVAVLVASVALGGIVRDASSERSDKLIDDIFDKFEEFRARRS